METMKSSKTSTRDSLQESYQGVVEPESLCIATDNGNPSPLDFVEFLPWACLKIHSSGLITVTRLLQEEYPRKSMKMASSKTGRSPKSSIGSSTSKSGEGDENTLATKENNQKRNSRRESAKSGRRTKRILGSLESLVAKPEGKIEERENNCVPVKAYYDIRNNLVEVSIERCSVDIDRRIIQVFAMCVPYHTLLYKLTIRRGGVTSTVLHEIGKLLPNSYLTHVCLDDATVPEANYYDLLKEVSQLKTLSLNRCLINDYACQQLAAAIDFGKPGCTLLTLELSSNHISDIGAQALGEVLRRNRRLLHLNLSGNMITDTGALTIFKHLMEFPLTHDEVLEMKRWRVKFVQHKETLGSIENKPIVHKSKVKKSTESLAKMNTLHGMDDSLYGVEREIEEKAKTVEYPFDLDHVVKREGYYFCIGNMFMCSLNLGYNSLTYSSIKKVHEVLRYQSQLTKPACSIGLLRIVVDGNITPEYCSEYVGIDIVLNKVMSDRTPKLLRHGKKSSARKSTRIISFEKHLPTQ